MLEGLFLGLQFSLVAKLLRHADHWRPAVDGDLHRQLHRSPTSWSWNFGDSEHLYGAEPEPRLHGGGSYTVALTATNANGNNTNTKTSYITVGNARWPISPARPSSARRR